MPYVYRRPHDYRVHPSQTRWRSTLAPPFITVMFILDINQNESFDLTINQNETVNLNINQKEQITLEI